MRSIRCAMPSCPFPLAAASTISSRLIRTPGPRVSNKPRRRVVAHFCDTTLVVFGGWGGGRRVGKFQRDRIGAEEAHGDAGLALKKWTSPRQ